MLKVGWIICLCYYLFWVLPQIKLNGSFMCHKKASVSSGWGLVRLPEGLRAEWKLGEWDLDTQVGQAPSLQGEQRLGKQRASLEKGRPLGWPWHRAHGRGKQGRRLCWPWQSDPKGLNRSLPCGLDSDRQWEAFKAWSMGGERVLL